MKTTFTKTLKVLGFTLSGFFLAFVVYANLEPAPMHTYVKPISMTILKVDDLKTPTEIQLRVSKAAGVTACTANPTSQLVSITFYPDETSANQLSQLVEKLTQSSVKKASYDDVEPSGPQCPVPLSYIMAFERAKYALCFR